MPWHTLLVLGGIGSGKASFSESLLAGDLGRRRIAADPSAGLAGLAQELAGARSEEALLVEDLAGWLTDSGRTGPDPAAPETLTAAVAACPARVVLVSSEVGLSPPATTAGNRRLTEALGTLNHRLAEAVDAVVLVIAGQPCWLKGDPGSRTGLPAPVFAASPAMGQLDPFSATLPDLAGLPTLDEPAKTAAGAQLAALGSIGLGALGEVVAFAAGARASVPPGPWRQIRTLVLHGDHRGAAAAGAVGGSHRADALRAGTDPLTLLAAPVGATVQVVATAPAAPIEAGPAMPDSDVETALATGWRLAEQAADEGVDLLVLGSIGDGAETAAAAVTAVLAPNTEPAGLLGRVRGVDGTIDDQAWMRRCAAVRDAVRRARAATHTTGRPVLAELGGPSLAVATGILLGAAARRTPVLLDGPVGAAAGLVARNLAAAARHWWLLPDAGGHPLVSRVAELLGLTPVMDLRLELGEGAAALAALPLLQAALTLTANLPAGDAASAPTG